MKQNKRENPPCLSDGSADGLVTLSRLPFQTEEEGRGPGLYNGCDGPRMSVLVTRPADSPGGDMHRCQWSHWKPRPGLGLQTLHLAAAA